jgi:hypothetical protein
MNTCLPKERPAGIGAEKYTGYGGVWEAGRNFPVTLV